MQFTYCQAQLLFFSSQISTFNSQSLNSEMKGAELTLKSQCAHPPTNNFIKLTRWVLLYLSTLKTAAIPKIKSVFVHYKISHFFKFQNFKQLEILSKISIFVIPICQILSIHFPIFKIPRLLMIGDPVKTLYIQAGL